MTITISKEEFESILSVATSATVQVYDKIKYTIDRIISSTINDYLGEVITDDVLVAQPDLLENIKQYVCLCSFEFQIRNLDLVLTPTGFGVVANNTTSPASAQRVDALERQVWQNCERVRGRLLDQLRRINGWGSQKNTFHQLTYPFFNFNELERRLGRAASGEEWTALGYKSYDIMKQCEKFFGRKQWDAIMVSVLCYSADNTVLNEAVERIKEITFLHSMNSPMMHYSFTDFKDFVEDNLDTFSIYKDSPEYKANHYEPFKNTKDSAAFIFAG